ncbi:hypothetical protein CJU89_6894 [Yarrowia sp. B02]|nr:hypothetical protein CJU89_6894 [Yarrowia sp. B02]
MLTDDILIQVFREASLEACVALSHVSGSSYSVWSALGGSVAKAKVLERVPWFTLDGDVDSWKKAALVAVRRSQRALKNAMKVKELKDVDIQSIEPGLDTDLLIKSMAVPLSLCRNDVEYVSSVDISKDADTRKAMKPLFPDERLQTTVGKYAVIEGTKLLSTRKALDVASMEITKTDYDRWAPKISAILSNKATSKSGVEIHLSGEGEALEVIDENEAFVLVRFSTPNGVAEELLRKGDPSLTVDVSAESSTRLYKADHRNTGMINLLPKGALMYKIVDEGTEKSHLLFIDEKLTPVFICELTRFQQVPLFYDIHQRFFVSYAGYLFFFYEGRFQRLWVDLGIRSSENEALCTWNTSFPAIGSLLDSRQAVMEEGLEFRIMQGKGDLNRYVGIRGTGRIVGDLLTGKTYFAKDAAEKDQFGIPFVDNDSSVGFYTCEKRVMDVLETEFSDVINGVAPMEKGLAAAFEDLCEQDSQGRLKKAKKLKKMKRRKTKKDLGKDELFLNNQWQVDDYYRDFEWPLEMGKSLFEPQDFTEVEFPGVF